MIRKRGKIIALIGISASGKSTIARELLIASKKDTIIVNRDAIRRLLYGLNDSNIGEFYKEVENRNRLENNVDLYVKTLIYEALEKGTDVILDETNLQYKRLKDLKYWNVNVQLMTVDCDLETALERDSKRQQPVGTTRIKKQFEQYTTVKYRIEHEPIDFTPKVLNKDSKKDYAIIFDIDGTLAHLNGRSPYDMKRVGEDLQDEHIMCLLMMIEEYVGSGTEIFFCSGREDISIKDTKEWFCNQIRSLGNIPESNYLFRKKVIKESIG